MLWSIGAGKSGVLSVSVIVAQKQFLFELVGGFGVAMLVKPRAGDTPIIHPVLIASLDGEGRAVVALSQQASQVDAFDLDPDVQLTFQSANQFAWMRGTATVERSRDEIERHWRPDWIDWFPKGPIDSSLCLLIVQVTEGEYWDRRIVGGIEQALESAKAYLVGSTQTDCPPHGKVKLSKPRARPPETSRRDLAKPAQSSGRPKIGQSGATPPSNRADDRPSSKPDQT